jgi:hypothetical protein
MKPEHIYQSLKEVAEKLNIFVLEQNLRKTSAGIKVKSGLCRVKGQNRFIMDKHISIHEKNELLADCLSQLPHDDIYIMPAVRSLIKKFARDIK